MVRVLELIRPFSGALLALGLLTGCSSSGSNEFLTAIRADLSGLGKSEETAPNPATSITRAQIDKLGVALIRVQETLTGETNLLVAFRKTDRQVTYVLRAERRLVLHGGLIQATYGFGDNLDPIGIGTQDPIAYPRSLADWPDSVKRQYTIAEHGPGVLVVVTCRYRRGTAGIVTIVEKPQRVQTINETCSGTGLRFTNRYDVDPATGVIWRSVQWTGPTQGFLIHEVLEPLD